jgi:hypothetical protein
MRRIRTLEEELNKKDANFDKSKQDELQKLQELEKARVRKSLEFASALKT